MPETSPEDRLLLAQLLPRPLFSATGAAAAPGQTHDPKHTHRHAAWSHWALDNLATISGVSSRTYPAVRLPGSFYERPGAEVRLVPHLELPVEQFDNGQANLPVRLCMLGNAALAPLWLPAEVKAARRALFGPLRRSADPQPFHDALESARDRLVASVTELLEEASPAWTQVAATLASTPDDLLDAATGSFSTEDVADYLDLPGWEISVDFESKLRLASGSAARRVGVWVVQGNHKDHGTASVGTLTPRLTANSQFRDDNYRPERDATLVALVRGLVIRRVIGSTGSVAAAPAAVGHLRAVPAKVGLKLPEASATAAAAFLDAFPTAAAGWAALTGWSAKASAILMVDEMAFGRAYEQVADALRRAETVAQDDVNKVLPLAWTSAGAVARITYARP